MNPVTIRASSWGDLMDCAYRWEGKHVLGMKMPAGVRALLGSAFHHATAEWDGSHLAGQPLPADEVAQMLVDFMRDPGFEVDYSDNFTVREAIPIGLKLLALYMQTINPLHFAAVELTINPIDVDLGDGLVIRMTGTLDRARVRRNEYGQAGYGIDDVKTGVLAVVMGEARTRIHKAQLGVYELLAERSLQQPFDLPARVIGCRTSFEPEIAIAEVPNAREALLGFDDQPGMLHVAGMYLKAGIFPPNPSSSLCADKFCPRFNQCKYRG